MLHPIAYVQYDKCSIACPTLLSPWIFVVPQSLFQKQFFFHSIFDFSAIPAKKNVWNWMTYLEEERMPAAPLKLFKEVCNLLGVFLWMDFEYR